MEQVIVAALYKFVTLEDYVAMRQPLLDACISAGTRGTLLLAREGINGTIAGDRGPMLIVNIRKLTLDVKIFALAENENSKTRVLDYGADEFAVKPISPTTVVEKLSMLLMKKPIESQIR